ncbi:MAG: RNA polymerase sigma factor [Saprospiraceae bacterium]
MTSSKYKNLTDEQLVSEFKQTKDNLVFGEIYNRFYGKVFYTCLGIVKDRDLACDLVQDTMIKVLKSLPTLQHEYLLGWWIHRIAKNLCFDYCKKRNQTNYLPLENCFEIAAEVYDMEASLLHEAKLDHLETVMGELNEEARTFIHLKYFENYSVEDLQSKYDLSESAVKMRLARARNKMAVIYSNLPQMKEVA